MMNGISISGLYLRIRSASILTDITAEFPEREITGLVGRNGSGKSMLLKCLCGFVRPTSGHIQIMGRDYWAERRFPDNLGFLIENPGYLPELSAMGNLQYLAAIRRKATKQDLLTALEKVKLRAADGKPVRKFSLGMKQRLGIAQAIMEDPQILILDEPLNGLDNDSAAEMRELFFSMRDAGKTIVLTSHNPLDIETLCQRVYECDSGRISRIS